MILNLFVNITSYYRVQLTKDASPVMVVELKLNSLKKDASKTEKAKKKDLSLQENDISHVKSAGFLKDISAKNLPKQHTSPRAGVAATHNNFFK